MAPTPRSAHAAIRARGRAIACVLAILAGSVGAAPDGKKLDLQGTDLDFADGTVDYKGQTAEYKDVVLRQNDIKVQADRAHQVGLTLDKSEWTLEGNVRVDSEQRGSLRSDQAVVEFRDKRLTRVTVRGMPAEFEQTRADSDQVTHGHADEIVYDVGDGTIRLSKIAGGEDAWVSVVSDGRNNKLSGALLVYNIREQKVQASTPAGTDGRVHMTISPSGKIEPKTQP
jgi:lipopolysaccharide transport protein LptA